jgi:hypothetical protein
MFDTLWTMAKNFGDVIRQNQLGEEVSESCLDVSLAMAESFPEEALNHVVVSVIADCSMIINQVEIDLQHNCFNPNLVFSMREEQEAVLCFLEKTKINEMEKFEGFWTEIEAMDEELDILCTSQTTRAVPATENKERWELLNEVEGTSKCWWAGLLMSTERGCQMFELVAEATKQMSTPAWRVD